MALGQHPSKRHDGSDFLPSDSHRAARAGAPLTMKMATLFIKADWVEFAQRLGLPAHSSNMRPCPLCNAIGQGMLHSPAEASLMSTPWRPSQDVDYDAAATRCEIWKDIDDDFHRRLAKLFFYDKSDKGYHGFCLKQDLPDLQLRRGDRLTPTDELPDVGKFPYLTTFPIRVCLWRAESGHAGL